jgi:hypothetical protein
MVLRLGCLLGLQVIISTLLIREQLAKEGVITRPDISLREFLSELVEKTFGAQNTVNWGTHRSTPEVREHRIIAETPRIVQRKTARSFYQPKKESARKFKGV